MQGDASKAPLTVIDANDEQPFTKLLKLVTEDVSHPLISRLVIEAFLAKLLKLVTEDVSQLLTLREAITEFLIKKLKLVTEDVSQLLTSRVASEVHPSTKKLKLVTEDVSQPLTSIVVSVVQLLIKLLKLVTEDVSQLLTSREASAVFRAKFAKLVTAEVFQPLASRVVNDVQPSTKLFKFVTEEVTSRSTSVISVRDLKALSKLPEKFSTAPFVTPSDFKNVLSADVNARSTSTTLTSDPPGKLPSPIV